MGEVTNEGILTNFANIYDATGYRTPDAQLIYDDKYRGGEAITCSKPDTIIFDTGEIQAGQLAGTYSVGFYYDSSTATVQGTPLMRFEVYEDGILMPEDTSVFSDGTLYEYDLNFVNYAYIYGLHDTKVFKASSTYQIVVKTSDSLTNDAVLDYVTLARHGENGLIDGRPRVQHIGIRNGGSTINISSYGTQRTMEVVIGTYDASIAANTKMDSIGWTYSTPFKTINFASASLRYDTPLTFKWVSTSFSTSTVYFTVYNNSNSDATVTGGQMRILLVGYI